MISTSRGGSRRRWPRTTGCGWCSTASRCSPGARKILWQLPGARIEAFLRDSFELKHQSFDYAVFLWDAHVGRYRSVREHGLPSL